MPGGHPCTVCYDHFLHSRESLSHLIRQPRRAPLNLVKHYPMMHHSVLHAQFGIKPLLKFIVVHIINHNPCTTQNHCCYFLNTITDAKYSAYDSIPSLTQCPILPSGWGDESTAEEHHHGTPENPRGKHRVREGHVGLRGRHQAAVLPRQATGEKSVAGLAQLPGLWDETRRWGKGESPVWEMPYCLRILWRILDEGEYMGELLTCFYLFI